MSRARHVRNPLSDRPTQPFDSAEEAWLWFAQCQVARLDGGRVRANWGAVGRPCDPDDIYRAVTGLVRRRVIGGHHVAVLGRFGRRMTPPDRFARAEAHDAVLWGEALDRLSTVLRGKGIVR